MTTPFERKNAVVLTEKFLTDLLSPQKYPKVPSIVRQHALHLLRHYPSQFHMDTVAEHEDMVDNPLHIQVFGNKF